MICPGAALWCAVGPGARAREERPPPARQARVRAFQSWPIPSGGIYAGIIRHMRPTRDGNLLIHQSSTNRIILVKVNGSEKTQ